MSEEASELAEQFHQRMVTAAGQQEIRRVLELHSPWCFHVAPRARFSDIRAKGLTPQVLGVADFQHSVVARQHGGTVRSIVCVRPQNGLPMPISKDPPLFAMAVRSSDLQELCIDYSMMAQWTLPAIIYEGNTGLADEQIIRRLLGNGSIGTFATVPPNDLRAWSKDAAIADPDSWSILSAIEEGDVLECGPTGLPIV